MQKLVTLMLILATMPFSAFSRVAVFDGRQQQVTVAQSVETILRFDEPQRTGVPASWKSVLKIRSSGNFVSVEPIEALTGVVDLVMQGTNTGEVTYIRLTAADPGREPDSEVIFRRAHPNDRQATEGETTISRSPLSPRETVEALVRGISQRFGPKHAIESSQFPISIDSRLYSDQPIPHMYRAPGLSFTALRTFTGGGVKGTVFRVKNVSTTEKQLEPGLIRGRWIAVDLRSSDTVLRPSQEILITLVHINAIPYNWATLFAEDAR